MSSTGHSDIGTDPAETATGTDFVTDVSETGSGHGCAACGSVTRGGEYVYAVGTISFRFPTLSLEKELAQALGRIESKGLTDRQAIHAVLSKPENRYIVRRLCWVLSVEHIETYILIPRDPADFTLLLDALRSNPSPNDLDVVIGIRGSVAPSAACNGLRVPLVAFDQIYSFDRQSLVRSIPRPEKTPAKEFSPIAEELLDRILQITGNAGATDEHRALNYLAVRYPGIYVRTAEAFADNSSLTAVEPRLSPLSGSRKIMDVVFSFTNRTTDVVEKALVRVDVTEAFPFLVSKLSSFYDR